MAGTKFKIATLGGAVLLVALGTVWGFGAWNDDGSGSLPEEFSAEKMKQQMKEDPSQMFRRGRELAEREDLTEEQKHQIFENGRQAMHELMNDRMNDYFGAKTEEDRNAVLDRQIDEFQAMQKRMRDEFEKRRAERQKREKEDKKDGDKDERERRGPRNHSTQERKQRSESRSPDEMAKMHKYFQALQKRAQERGIQMGGPGRGPGGPGGRGPGGPGRGR